MKQGVLVVLLGLSLLASAIALLIQPQTAKPMQLSPRLLLPIAAALGFLAGVVGIGGGIFLAPILHLIRWAEARAVAATASLFILVNSLFGLTGQLIKGKGGEMVGAVASHWPLLVAVLIGGAIGTELAVDRARAADPAADRLAGRRRRDSACCVASNAFRALASRAAVLASVHKLGGHVADKRRSSRNRMRRAPNWARLGRHVAWKGQAHFLF